MKKRTKGILIKSLISLLITFIYFYLIFSDIAASFNSIGQALFLFVFNPLFTFFIILEGYLISSENFSTASWSFYTQEVWWLSYILTFFYYYYLITLVCWLRNRKKQKKPQKKTKKEKELVL